MVYKKRTYYKKSGSKKTSMKKMVDKQIKQVLSKELETKFIQSSVATAINLSGGAISFTSSSNPGYASFTTIPQGDNEGQRVGIRIRLKAFHLKFEVALKDGLLITNSPSSCHLRIIFFRTKEDTSDQKTTWDPSSELLRPATALGIKNDIFAHKYHICYDKTITLINNSFWNGTAEDSGVGPKSTHISREIIIKGKRLGSPNVIFTNDPTNNCGIGHLYGVAYPYYDSGLFTNDPVLTFNFKVLYTDA